MRAGCHTVPLICINCWLEPLCHGCLEETGMSQLSCQWSIRGRMSVAHRGFSPFAVTWDLGWCQQGLPFWEELRENHVSYGQSSDPGSELRICSPGVGWGAVYPLPTGLKVPEWPVGLSPWLGVFEMNTGGGTDRSQETWILASLRLQVGCGGALLRLQDSMEQGWRWRIWIYLRFFLMWLCFTSAVGEGEELISPCLSPGFKSEWQHAEIVYKIKGQKAGIVIYHSCFSRMIHSHCLSKTPVSVYCSVWLLLMCCQRDPAVPLSCAMVCLSGQ